MSQQLTTRDPVTEVCETIRRDEFQAQLQAALPPSVSLARFTRVSLIAVQQNPDIVSGDRRSLFMALVTCARDGLVPDGKEAALVKFGQKIGYLPMVGGYRKKAAQHGWSLEAFPVYSGDLFEFQLGLEPTVKHVPPQQLDADRGALTGAYAVATHTDGRKLVEVMSKQQIELVKSASRAAGGDLWNKWVERAYCKTVARRLFQSLPLAEPDESVGRMIDADAVEVASAPVPALAGLPTVMPEEVEAELVDEEPEA